MVSISQADDIAACEKELDAQGHCYLGDLLVLDVTENVVPAGPCNWDPFGFKGTDEYKKAYSVKLSSWGVAQRVEKIVPDVVAKYQTLLYFTTFRKTLRSNVSVDKEQDCHLADHVELWQYFNVKGVGLGYNPAPPEIVLHAVINMWSIPMLDEDDWLETGSRGVSHTIAHETEHDVCCHIRFVDRETGMVSSALLGHQGAHWSLFYNSYGQMMYGTNWRDNGDGTYYGLWPEYGTRAMDRYLWGLVPPNEVPDTYLVDTSDKTDCVPKQRTLDAIAKDCPNKALEVFDMCLDPPYQRDRLAGCEPFHAAVPLASAFYQVTAKGKKKWITIQDVLDANGQRVPTYKDSPKVMTQIFALLTKKYDDGRPGYEGLNQENLDKVNRGRRIYNRYLYTITGYKLRNTNTLDFKDETGLWEWGGLPDWSRNTELEDWKGVNLAKPLAVTRIKPTAITKNGHRFFIEEDERGFLPLYIKDKTSSITHDNVRLHGADYDGLMVRMTVPLPEDGTPKLLKGAFELKGDKGTERVRFPVYADGKEHTIVVHPPHKLLKADSCAGCIVFCKYFEKIEDEQGNEKDDPRQGWYQSCERDKYKTDVEEVLIKKGKCRDDEGRTMCGPYCSRPSTDPVLEQSDPEGWYDSCESKLDDTFHTLTFYPVISDEASTIKKPVMLDRIDIFHSIYGIEDEDKQKNAEKDWDGDGLINAFDNCPEVANQDQIDHNDDDKGDACDDFDADGVLNAYDNCLTTVNSLQQDDDEDGVGNACDPDYDDGGCTVTASGRPGLTSLAALALLLVGLLYGRRRRQP
jgi:MYXO-CTERM domain-containing protein